MPERVMLGLDLLSGEHRAIVVNASGEIISRISGETAIAKISGEAIKVSGEAVKVSGAVVKISGEAVEISGEAVRMSGEAVKISGEAVKVSGATVIAKISGETVIAKVSGETLTAKTSGETISVEVPTTVKTGPIQVVTGASGGQVLYSGTIKSATVKAITENSGVIALGGETDRPWYEAVCSGQGLILDAGDAQSLDVDNFDAIYVVAQVSGDQVSFNGVN